MICCTFAGVLGSGFAATGVLGVGGASTLYSVGATYTPDLQTQREAAQGTRHVQHHAALSPDKPDEPSGRDDCEASWVSRLHSLRRRDHDAGGSHARNAAAAELNDGISQICAAMSWMAVDCAGAMRAGGGTFVAWIALRDEYVGGRVVDDQQLAQHLLTHGLGDAHALAVDVQFHEELKMRSEAGFGCSRRVLLGAEVHLDGAAGAFSRGLTEHCRDEAVQLRLLLGQVHQRDPRVWRWNKAHVAGVQGLDIL